MYQSLSQLAHIAGGVDLKNPAASLDSFKNKVAKTLGIDIPNSSGSGSDLNNVKMYDAFKIRGDPVYDIDWIGMIMDRSNPNALDWAYIQSIQTPAIEIEHLPVFRGGKMSNYAGVMNVGNIDIGLYTDTNAKAMKFASSWVASIYDNSTGDYFLPKDYKKDIYVYILDAGQQTVALLKFFGCFPTNWTSYNLHGGTATPLITTLNLSVDSFSIGSDNGSNAAQKISDNAILASF